MRNVQEGKPTCPLEAWNRLSINPSLLNEQNKKKTALGSVIFRLPVPSNCKASTSASLPRNTFLATLLLFSHRSLSGPFLPWSFLCLLNPDAGAFAILIGGSDFRSVECDDWKLEAPGVKVVSERVYIAYCSSLIARRQEFIHEPTRIRRDYDTKALWQLAELTFSLL